MARKGTRRTPASICWRPSCTGTPATRSPRSASGSAMPRRLPSAARSSGTPASRRRLSGAPVGPRDGPGELSPAAEARGPCSGPATACAAAVSSAPGSRASSSTERRCVQAPRGPRSPARARDPKPRPSRARSATPARAPSRRQFSRRSFGLPPIRQSAPVSSEGVASTFFAQQRRGSARPPTGCWSEPAAVGGFFQIPRDPADLNARGPWTYRASVGPEPTISPLTPQARRAGAPALAHFPSNRRICRLNTSGRE